MDDYGKFEDAKMQAAVVMYRNIQRRVLEKLFSVCLVTFVKNLKVRKVSYCNDHH